MSIASLGQVFQSVGDAGNQFADAKLLAYRTRINELLDKLGIKTGETSLADMQERLRRLKLQPETEDAKFNQTIATFKRVFKRDPNDDEMKILFGMPAQGQVKSPFELWKAQHPNGTYEEWKKESEKTAPTKPVKDNTYDPAGHLRTAFLNPQTGEVVAWGPLTPEKEAFHYITDQEGNVHAVQMPTVRKVNPGEIRMSQEAERQWATINAAKPAAVRTGGGGGGGAGGQGNIIGQTTPKYPPPLANALKTAQARYNSWIGANKNAQYHTPRTDLAIIFAAVRSQVEGAGRINNTELEREIKAGSYGDRFRRQWQMAVTGTLPDDQRQDLLNVIRNSWGAAAQTARSQWQTDLPGKPMPTYIQGEDIDQKEHKSDTPPPGAKVRDYSQFGAKPQGGVPSLKPDTKPIGLLVPGNIDLSNRPMIRNADGTLSTEYSTSFRDDEGREVLVPTVVNGKFLTADGKKPRQGSPEEKKMFERAKQYYLKTGQHLGIFDTPEHADAAAIAIHNLQDKRYH